MNSSTDTGPVVWSHDYRAKLKEENYKTREQTLEFTSSIVDTTRQIKANRLYVEKKKVSVIGLPKLTS